MYKNDFKEFHKALEQAIELNKDEDRKRKEKTSK
jgi:Zn-dependent M32 family carboxypeptidase